MKKSAVIAIVVGSVLGTLILCLGAYFIFSNGEKARDIPDIEDDYRYENRGGYSQRIYDHYDENATIVYCNSYDGFLNIRAEASSKSEILGKFRNGPEGAVYLSTSGNWVKVDCNGIVGYVHKPSVSYSPTKEVTIDVDAKWLMGPWYPSSKEYAYLIFNNGTYAVQYYYGTIAYGTYKLEGDEIVFSANMVRGGLGFDIASYERYRISMSPKRIGHLTKRMLIKADDAWKYSGELVWTWSEFTDIMKEVKRMVK